MSELDGVFIQIKLITLDIICSKIVVQCREKAKNKANESEKENGFPYILELWWRHFLRILASYLKNHPTKRIDYQQKMFFMLIYLMYLTMCT